MRANSGLKGSEYATPVLGLIYLRYADLRFAPVHDELAAKATGRRSITPADYHAKGVLFVPEEARFAHLLGLAEGADLGKAIDAAMVAIEADDTALGGGQRNRKWAAFKILDTDDQSIVVGLLCSSDEACKALFGANAGLHNHWGGWRSVCLR